MKDWISSETRAIAAGLGLSLAAAMPAAAQTLPQAGLWELAVTLEGAPMGGGTRSGKTCLAAEALAAAPERSLLEAAARQDKAERGAPQCELRSIQREASADGKSTSTAWQATCEGPMGKMQGPGSGSLGAASARLQQSFQVKLPIGSLTLKQSLVAQRVGDC